MPKFGVGAILENHSSLYLDCDRMHSCWQMEIGSRIHKEVRWKVRQHLPAPRCSNFNQHSEKINNKGRVGWISCRFEWQGASTWMPRAWENVRFYPAITPSNSHLSFPVHAFWVKADLNWNLTKVKANQSRVPLFQTEILNSWVSIVWLCLLWR